MGTNSFFAFGFVLFPFNLFLHNKKSVPIKILTWLKQFE